MKTPPIRSEITPNLASTCDNVIDVKDQMTFKVPLSFGALAPRWGAIQVPRKEESEPNRRSTF
jgi:hypothetical protein